MGKKYGVLVTQSCKENTSHNLCSGLLIVIVSVNLRYDEEFCANTARKEHIAYLAQAYDEPHGIWMMSFW
jgi:hypothetical protein